MSFCAGKWITKKLAVLCTLISQFERPFFSSRHNLIFGGKKFKQRFCVPRNRRDFLVCFRGAVVGKEESRGSRAGNAFGIGRIVCCTRR